MDYRKHQIKLLLRIILLMVFMFCFTYSIFSSNYTYAVVSALVILLATINLFAFTNLQFKEVINFFETIKYKDFTRHYNTKSSTTEVNQLHFQFNEVSELIRKINTDKEAHNIYLSKILELIQTGILAFKIQTGEIIWLNASFLKLIDVPTIKNIGFLETRRQELFQIIVSSDIMSDVTLDITVNGAKVKLLITCTVFELSNSQFKLVVVQNIEDTHNQIESDSWKKLLSVMTHEIMNSIAPIASLTETLQNQIQEHIVNPESQIEIDDLNAGLETIHRRSEGLMKFAQTYRSLSKVTQIHANNAMVNSLFENIKKLMVGELLNKGISIEYQVSPPDLSVNIDSYLIEQVLINLILNAADALQSVEAPIIQLHGSKNIDGNVVLKVIDNGKGIPHEVMENVFIPFFTTKKNGSGIGLSLCKQIMILHKGKIQINSIEGKGTSVILVFY